MGSRGRGGESNEQGLTMGVMSKTTNVTSGEGQVDLTVGVRGEGDEQSLIVGATGGGNSGEGKATSYKGNASRAGVEAMESYDRAKVMNEKGQKYLYDYKK